LVRPRWGIAKRKEKVKFKIYFRTHSKGKEISEIADKRKKENFFYKTREQKEQISSCNFDGRKD
jgi:hypothetical protein